MFYDYEDLTDYNDRFVKGFIENNQNELVNAINYYAKKEHLKIIQISYAKDSRSIDRAIVLFEKQLN